MLRAAAEGTLLNLKHWPAFISASKSKAVAGQAMNYSPKNCLLSILTHSGRNIELLSRYGPNGSDPASNEREVLLLPTQYRIAAVRQTTFFAEIELLEL